ncbi:MAG: DUF5071 domain-containing protein [Clostridia bacterium]|nr:DUF5071 domain-containing protein [Clostridia bacterium]
MGISIDTLFEYLSRKNSEDVQKLGISIARKIKNLSVLIMPIEDKSIWENCAKILCEKSDEELELYFFDLFEWLKDMNWPGAYQIYDRLLCVEKEDFLYIFETVFFTAKQLQDNVWVSALQVFLSEYSLKHSKCIIPDRLQNLL